MRFGNPVAGDRNGGTDPNESEALALNAPGCAGMLSGFCTSRCELVKEVLDVNSGQVKLGREYSVLRSLAIGSCVAVVAYDPRKKVGALAHVMLPGRARPFTSEKTRYAVDALEELGAVLAAAGSRLADADICLVGAGNVLQRSDDTICESNIRSVKGILGRQRIPVRAAVLGGTERKGVCLCVKTGRVSHTVGESADRFLWEPQPAGAREADCGDPRHGQRCN